MHKDLFAAKKSLKKLCKRDIIEDKPKNKNTSKGNFTEMSTLKRAVTINDVSGIGKCSITVACPILSALGIETAVLPTALLSTHTGGFHEYSFLDLTSEMNKIIDHWESLDIKFDAIYSGYLGSAEQIAIVNRFIDIFKKDDTLLMVDPVMGDAGRFYAGFTNDHVKGMKTLCSRADLIVPNMTEAMFLLGKEYEDGPYSEEFIKEILRCMADTGCRMTVLTGVHFDHEYVGAASYDSETHEFGISLAPRIEGFYHGTGDVFASALLAALMNGMTLGTATKTAVDFTENSIIRTRKANTDTRFGVDFETGIPDLIESVLNKRR